MQFQKIRSTLTRLNLLILGILVSTAVGTSVLSTSLQNQSWGEGFWQNLSTEIIGAFLTYLLIEMFGKSLNIDAEEKRVLVRQLGNIDNVITTKAIHDLWYKGWLQDGSLIGESLKYGNFEGGDLAVCDLRAYLKSPGRG